MRFRLGVQVLMLVTNSLKNDLASPNQFIAGQALGAMGNIASAQVCTLVHASGIMHACVFMRSSDARVANRRVGFARADRKRP
jgi:hypothetical protein